MTNGLVCVWQLFNVSIRRIRLEITHLTEEYVSNKIVYLRKVNVFLQIHNEGNKVLAVHRFHGMFSQTCTLIR